MTDAASSDQDAVVHVDGLELGEAHLLLKYSEWAGWSYGEL